MRLQIGIQEVTGSILGPTTYLSKLFGHEIFSTAILSQPPIVSYWRNHGHLVLVNRLGSLPGNSVDRLTDLLDITLIVLPGS